MKDARNWYIFKDKRAIILPRFFSSTHLSSDRSDLRRVIWWSILSIREQYVSDIGNEQVEIRFDYVVEKTFKDIQDCCGAEIIKIQDLASEIESQLNEWIKYCLLESSDADNISQCELVKALINYYGLDTKLLIKDIQQNPMYEARIRQMEEEIQELATENKSLEKKLSQRVKKVQDSPESNESVLEQSSDGSSLAELRDFLKLIDSKYSFDTLNAIQSGQESPLTFRSFIAHLFYSLRKKGFGQYPPQDIFDLPYESSGLYECDGFEVPPGGTLKVQVAKRGWALQAKGRILPAKRARVTKVT